MSVTAPLDYSARVWCPKCPDQRLDTDHTVLDNDRRYCALLWCAGCHRHYRLDVRLTTHSGPLPMRLPWAKFVESCPRSWCQTSDGVQLDGPNLVALADQLGTHTNKLHRWMRDGIPVAEADTLAIAVGLHPAVIWPDEWATFADLAPAGSAA